MALAESSTSQIWGRRTYAALLVLIGAPLAGGGAWLIDLGGSPYYLIAGSLVIASGVFVWHGRCAGAWLYAAFLVATLAWALWEAGMDGWALMPRLVAPAVVGLGFLVPLVRPAASGSGPGWLGFGIALAGAFVLGILLHRTDPDEPDPIFQTGRTALPALVAPQPATAVSGDWLNYGNDQGGGRYSPLDQLSPANVGRLKRAWVLHTGALNPDGSEKLEVTPLKVGDAVYLCTGYNDVLSVDAETGRVNWRFHSGVRAADVPAGVCRGVAYYAVPGSSGDCAARIITATVDARLIALDAKSGKPCSDFGSKGTTSLANGVGIAPKGYYYVTSAPTIVHGKIVVGGFVLDGQYWGEPSGVIRAYDAKTGRFAWAFDMGRSNDHREPSPGGHYTLATPNSWAPMSADEQLGLVYVPTGNATPDYYGAQRRPFDDKYSSSVLAIDAETGALRWSFQTAHHDLWDYDVASQPTLVDLPGGIPALIQPTKRGEIFLLDRRTGRPLTPVVERPVPQGGVAPGERLSPTQPFSIGMPSFRGPSLRERDMWGITPIDQLICRIMFRQARYEGPMTPPGLERPTVVYPGYLGGMDWGGVSIDPLRHLMIVNANRVANYDQLLPRRTADKLGLRPWGNGYTNNIAGAGAQANTPYAADVRVFFSPLWIPCNKPPYGMITAVDLASRKVIWSKPLGTARDSGVLGIPSMLPIAMGVPNSGGSLVTKGGLVFIGASQERTFRAIDIRNGKELWSDRMPGSGIATPMSYWSSRSGRQFVVMSAGGAKYLGSKTSDAIVAYALPN